MKIVSWNCHGAFRKKYSYLQSLNADIYVIQECENPNKYKEDFGKFSENMKYFWCGENDNRGLAVFVFHDILIEENPWDKYCLRNFISLKVNNDFDLLCVWACSPYIEEYYIYQSINFKYYSNNMVIIGDLNSNAKWDKNHGRRNHTNVVNSLEEIGLVSAYHYLYKETQGNESKNTFYLQYKKEKGYHIDYCFLSPKRLQTYSIQNEDNWLKHSDHVPIIVEINTEKDLMES